MYNRKFKTLVDYIEKVPAVQKPIAVGEEDGYWWIKFKLDIEHKLAWSVVQEFGHVMNYLSPNQRLPTVFYPASPPPYMNGGPADFLSWIIETKDKEFKPGTLMKWLEGRLPNPVDDMEQWIEE